MTVRANDPVLITGCSTGIGKLTAEHLLDYGYTVVATARAPESLAGLEARGAFTIALDVNDEASMTRAVKEVEQRFGAVAALVNNAGFGEYGAVETVPINDARRQFETNVFGLARMCQLVLPGMRRRGGGRIVNMSSVGGRMTFPGGGFYNASKYAVEALSDALRFETAPFGVTVSLIEPNLIRHTGFEGPVAGSLSRNTTSDGPYAGLRAAILDQMSRCFEDDRMSSPPLDVARTVRRALNARRPRTRYVVSTSGKLILLSRRWISDLSMDRILRGQFGLRSDGMYIGKHGGGQPRAADGKEARQRSGVGGTSTTGTTPR